MSSPPGPIWTPSAERRAASQLARFADQVGRRADYADLHEWSVTEPAEFWSAVWDFGGVVGDRGHAPIVGGPDLPSTRFFPDAELNFAENLLRRDGEDAALWFRGEDGTARALSWRELRQLVSQLQQLLADSGIGAGDRVAAWLPNIPETYAVMLAATSLGAVFSSTSPDFGPAGVLDRFGQIEPKVLFTADGYHYGGRWQDCRGRLGEMIGGLGSVVRVVEVGYDGGWGRALDAYTPQPLAFARVPFDHPVYILYSSGTTGVPKCIVHRTGGILLKHLVEHKLHSDVRPGDRVFYFTTAGWMMWNWLASGLASEATLVLYDGSPFHPTGNVLFDLVDDASITLFGTSAKFIDALAKAQLSPRSTHSLASLRTIASTGSPLSPEGFAYVYEHIKADVHLASISGGTDLCGCLVAGDPTGPVWAGEIQRPGLGMAIDVVDDGGGSLGPGERGELVCRNAFPSMPLGFWRDPRDERYHAAYYERFPGMWHQADFAAWTEHGGIVISGRSDATLNPGGVRIGTAEIYRLVDALDEVVESLVIGQAWDGDTRIVLFVVLGDGEALTDELVGRMRSAVRVGASPRHVPAVVVAVPELPRTRSGKLAELAVRDVVHGRGVANVEALANPESLDFFRDRAELSP